MREDQWKRFLTRPLPNGNKGWQRQSARKVYSSGSCDVTSDTCRTSSGPSVPDAVLSECSLPIVSSFRCALICWPEWSIHWDRLGGHKVPRSHLRTGCNASVPCGWTCCPRHKRKSPVRVNSDIHTTVSGQNVVHLLSVDICQSKVATSMTVC